MRPERDNIAAPELPGRIKWLNLAEPPKMAVMSATGPVLVHFFDPLQLNSVRALPYVAEWNRRYAPHGLTTLGIHSPRFALTIDSEVATESIDRLGIEHPVALDLDYAIWHDYAPLGWPALFLWGRGGALRWAHHGEGEYRGTEEAIQEELRTDDVTLELPDPMKPLRDTDAPGALVEPPSGEIFPGGSPREPWDAAVNGRELQLSCDAGEAWVVADGNGEIAVEVHGHPSSAVGLPPAGLIKLAGSGRHEEHRVALKLSGDVRVWAFSFAAGVP